MPYKNSVVIISFGSLTYSSQGSLGSHYNIDESVFSGSVQTLANILTSWGTEVGGYFQLSICKQGGTGQLLLCHVTLSPQLALSSTALRQEGVISLFFQCSSHLENPSLFQLWKPRGKSTHLKALITEITELTVFTPGGMLGFHFTASQLWIKKSSKCQLGQNPRSSCYSSLFKVSRRQDPWIYISLEFHILFL